MILGRDWTGFEATALQIATRQSVRMFAGRLGVDPRAVTKWRARGRSITLRPGTQQLLDIELSRADVHDQQRFRHLISGDTLTSSEPPGTTEQRSYEPIPCFADADQGDAETAESLRMTLTLCKTADGTRGSAAVRATVLAIIGRVRDRARSESPRNRHALLVLGSEAAEFAGWLYRDGDDERRLGSHYTAALLTLQTALCYMEAGRPARAVQLFDRALNAASFSPRDYGFWLSWNAQALALAGDPDHAATVALEAVRRANSTQSQRTISVARGLLDVLRPWQHRPQVKTLREVLRTM